MGIHSNYLKILSQEELSLKYSDKRCRDCKQIKSRKNFYENLESRDGLSSYCRKCGTLRGINYRKKNLKKSLWTAAKYRSELRGREFNIEVEDIDIPEYCPILGLKLEVNRGLKDNSITLDRIDNSKGYIKGNIVIISHKANRIKGHASFKDLEKIYEFYKKFQID